MEHIELLEQQHQEMQELMQANHSKLEGLLSGILQAIPAATTNEDIIAAIGKFAADVRQIKLLPPEVNVEATTVNVNQDRVVQSIETAAAKLTAELAKIKPVEKGLEKWKCEFFRNADGVIIQSNFEQIK